MLSSKSMYQVFLALQLGAKPKRCQQGVLMVASKGVQMAGGWPYEVLGGHVRVPTVKRVAEDPIQPTSSAELPILSPKGEVVPPLFHESPKFCFICQQVMSATLSHHVLVAHLPWWWHYSCACF